MVTYTVPPSTEALEEWAQATFTVVSDLPSAGEVARHIRPSEYMHLYYIPQSDEILFHTARWRTDGVGLIMLFDALLDLAFGNHASDSDKDPVNCLPWGEEVRRLPHSLESLLPIPAILSSSQKALAQKDAASFAMADGVVGIPFMGDWTTLLAATGSVWMQLSPDTTRKLIQACKQRQITVTSAVHASLACANYKLQPPHLQGRSYASTIRVNLRPHLGEKYTSSAYASGAYVATWLESVPQPSSASVEADWDMYARLYHEMYRLKSPPDHMAAHCEYGRIVVDALHNPPPPAAEPDCNVDISSIGVVDKWVRPFYGLQRGARAQYWGRDADETVRLFCMDL